MPLPEGGGDRNAMPLYAFPDAQVMHDFMPEMPLRVSSLRGLGAYTNVFAIESFIDELARLAGTDPVEFRLDHLADPRARSGQNSAAATVWLEIGGIPRLAAARGSPSPGTRTSRAIARCRRGRGQPRERPGAAGAGDRGGRQRASDQP